jgi:tellurite resistance protein
MPHRILKENDVSLLRSEIEMLMLERQSLLDTVGAAARFVASLDSSVLPKEARGTAQLLTKSLNELNDETLRDALEKVKG